MSGLWTDGQLYGSIKIELSLIIIFISGIVLHDLVKENTFFLPLTVQRLTKKKNSV